MSCVLTNVFIFQFMRQSYSLWLMFHGFPIYNGRFELFYNGPMNGVALRKSPMVSVNGFLLFLLSVKSRDRAGTRFGILKAKKKERHHISYEKSRVEKRRTKSSTVDRFDRNTTGAE